MKASTEMCNQNSLGNRPINLLCRTTDESGPETSVDITDIRRPRTPAMFLAVVVLFVLVGFSGLLSMAQESTSTGFAGHITDSTKASIPDATIRLVNLATGAERTAVTNDQGFFTITNLPPSGYSLRAEKNGFKAYTINHLDLVVGVVGREEISLQVGSTTETVVVNTDPPQLQTSEATIGQVIETAQINDLPLNGRNIVNLASLAAGVSAPSQQNTGAPDQSGNRNLYITVDGGRTSSNNYVIDGVYARSIRFNELSILPSVDTIQEFNLLRSSAGTEYGQGIATVSIVTKSGGNVVHGTAFEFARSQIFDARNYFDTALVVPKKPVLRQNQFGGTFGGPLLKEKEFFFGGYEGKRMAQGRTYFANFPDATAYEGATSQFALALIPYLPKPNCTTCGNNNYKEVKNYIDNFDEWMIRGDQNLSSKHSLFERYINFSAYQQMVPVTAMMVSFPMKGQNLSLGDTYMINDSTINELRLGYNRSYGFAPTNDPNPGINFVEKEGIENLQGGINPKMYGLPLVIIPGYNLMGEFNNLQGDTENIFSLGDTISKTLKHHSLRTGFQIQRRQLAQITDEDTLGSYVFPNIGFFFNNGISVSSSGGLGSSLGHYTDLTYGIFVNDVWQATRRLTVNAGLRWEYVAPFVEKDGLAGGFDFASGKIAFHKVPTDIPASMASVVNTTPGFFRNSIVDPDYNGFGPRLGMSYLVNDKTVVRAGAGIYFENQNSEELTFTRNIPPLYIDDVLGFGPVAGLFPSLSDVSTVPAPQSVYPGNRSPYSEEWSASIERNLGHQTMVEVAYTGSTTHKLWIHYDANEDTTFALNSNSDPTQGPVAVRPYPQFGHGLLTTANKAGATFNGASIKVEQRPVKGFYYLANYQFSKNLDNATGVTANDTSYSTNFRFDHSYSALDVRHRGTGSVGYELPFGKQKQWLTGPVGNAIAGGWQVEGIVTLRKGFPFSVTGGSGNCLCGSQVIQRVDLAPGRTTGAIKNASINEWFDPTAYVAPTPGYQGLVTRNTLRGPGFAEADISLARNFPIFEHMQGQFRAEGFNVLNRGNFGNPGTNISNGNAGVISGTSADNRDLQFAFKLTW